MNEQLSLFNLSPFELKIITDRRELNNKNYPASGWVQSYYKDRHGKTTTWQEMYGLYYQFCYRKNDRIITHYISKKRKEMVVRMISEGRRAEEIARYLTSKSTRPKTSNQ